jgi:hypothetical protein
MKTRAYPNEISFQKTKEESLDASDTHITALQYYIFDSPRSEKENTTAP